MKTTIININKSQQKTKQRHIHATIKLKLTEMRNGRFSELIRLSHQAPFSHELVQWKRMWVYKNHESTLKKRSRNLKKRSHSLPARIWPMYRGNSRESVRLHSGILQAEADTGVEKIIQSSSPTRSFFSVNNWDWTEQKTSKQLSMMKLE